MLQHQLSLAVLASAFAVFLGDEDAEANQSGYREGWYACRLRGDRVDVHPGCGIQGHGNYGVRNHRWINSGQNHNGNRTHFNGGYRSGGYGCNL